MMSQQSQGTNSSPADLPMKRKRGRPRKDESLLQGENSIVMPASDSARKNNLSVSTSTCPKVENDMVGQVVSGVIEGSFDAGYLLNVKVGDTDTQLRGVVFLPGQFIPITPANDVAPHFPMLQRKEIPIPAPGSTSQSRLSEKPSLELCAPAFSTQVPPFDHQSSVEAASGKQPASVVAPPADNLPVNEPSPPFVGIATQQRTSESGFENSHSVQNNKQAAELDNSVLMPKDHVLSYNPAASDKQPASIMVPLAENLPKNDMYPPFGHKIVLQQGLESGLDIPAAEHGMNKCLVLKDHGQVFPGQVPTLETQSPVPVTLDGQAASVSLPLIDNLTKNDAGLPMEGKVVQKQTPNPGLEIPPSVGNQSVDPKNQGIFLNEAPPFEIHSAVPMELDNQPASALIHVPDNTSMNDTPSSLEGKPLPQQTSESEFGISSSMQDNTQVLEVNSNAPVHPEQISPYGLHLCTYSRHVVPPAEILPGNVSYPSWEGKLAPQPTSESGPEQQRIDLLAPFELQSDKSLGKNTGSCLEAEVTPQQNLMSGLGNQTAPLMALLKSDKVVEQDKVVQDFESSDLLKSSMIDQEATKDVESGPSLNDKLPFTGTEHLGADSAFKLNAFIHEDVKKPCIEMATEEADGGNDLGLRIGCEGEDRQNI